MGELATDPRVSIVEHALHHPDLGTGFVVEIDLGQLPEWKGELRIKPVEYPLPDVHRSGRPGKGLERTKNPLVAMGLFFANLAYAAGGSRNTYDLDLIPQVAFPLDSNVVIYEDGSFGLRKVPADKRLHILIPHAMVHDSDRVYFMVPDSIFSRPVEFLYTPYLFPDTLVPDLKVEVVKKVGTRYAGASGQMLTVHYEFPGYYKSLNSNCAFLWPRITLNGKYTVYEPRNYLYPAEWELLDHAAGELTFFVPNAFYDDEGRATVDLSCKCTRGRMRLGYVKLELEEEEMEKVEVEITVEKMVRKERLKSLTIIPLNLSVIVGGIAIEFSRPSEIHSDNKPVWSWKENNSFSLSALLNDSINFRAVNGNSVNKGFSTFRASFWTEISDRMEDGKNKKLFFRDDSELMRETYILFTYPMILKSN
jgi:hypothetical protein